MKNTVKIKNSDIDINESTNIKIGNIENKVDKESVGDDTRSHVSEVIKKTGKIDKVIAIVFVMAVIALVVVLKNI